ncbi:MAG: chromosomal replication initiator protein dnaA [candidate division NC10 bacterium CSP1-5]|nr:MAG: chromosomal replication initiator protein dnaA [candidate division NC10 bacterium CSP1-5]
MSGQSLMSQEVWQAAISNIQRQLIPHSFATWFRPLTLGTIHNNRLQILLPNRFFKEWFEEHYLEFLRSALEDLLFTRVEIELVVPEQDASPPPPPKETPPKRTVRRSGPTTSLNAKYTFDSFVVGAGNQLAHAASLAIAEQISKVYNPLFVYGGVGLGKTHLLHAIGHLVLERDNLVRVSYVSSEKFTNDLINAIRFDATSEFRNRYRSVDVLLIDDIQFIAGKERTQEEFFHTFNDLYNASKQIVLTSDSIPKEIPGLEERLRSRFEWGLIADIQAPDMETKAAILRKKAQAEGVQIPDEVSLFIASNVKSNVRELEGYLVRIVAYASLTNQAITLDLAREILKEFMNGDRAITIPRILEVVSDFFRLNEKELLSRSRHKSIVLPRQVAMYLCRTQTNASLPDIGAELGGKDHSTVIHACAKVRELIAKDEKFRKQLHDLTNRLTG